MIYCCNKMDATILNYSKASFEALYSDNIRKNVAVEDLKRGIIALNSKDDTVKEATNFTSQVIVISEELKMNLEDKKVVTGGLRFLSRCQRLTVAGIIRSGTVRFWILYETIGPIKDEKSWKTFRDKLRLKRAGSAWTSSVHVPTSDVNVHSSRPRSSGRGEDRGERVSVSNPPVAKSKMHLEKIESVHFGNNSSQTDDDDSVDAPRSRSFNRPMVRHASIRMSSANADDDDVDGSDDDYESSGSEDESETPLAALKEERSLSAREAVAAQEAAEAAAAAAAGAEQPVKMSLMDLLGRRGIKARPSFHARIRSAGFAPGSSWFSEGTARFAVATSWKFLIYFDFHFHFHL
ncbi:hypothetical protein V6N13_100109 [Hibiscus sabdariffa]